MKQKFLSEFCRTPSKKCNFFTKSGGSKRRAKPVIHHQLRELRVSWKNWYSLALQGPGVLREKNLTFKSRSFDNTMWHPLKLIKTYLFLEKLFSRTRNAVAYYALSWHVDSHKWFKREHILLGTRCLCKSNFFSLQTRIWREWKITIGLSVTNPRWFDSWFCGNACGPGGRCNYSTLTLPVGTKVVPK